MYWALVHSLILMILDGDGDGDGDKCKPGAGLPLCCWA